MDDDGSFTQERIRFVTSILDVIQQKDEAGQEYWDARDLAKLLGYMKYVSFTPVLRKAEKACEEAGEKISDHFPHVQKMIAGRKGEQRPSDTVHLSLYGCYLVVENSDPTSRPVVALTQRLNRFFKDIKDIYSELIERTERAEVQVKVLEAELADARDIEKTQQRYQEVMAEVDAVRIEIKGAKAEMQELRAENSRVAQELEEKYAGPINELKEELAYFSQLFANDDFSPEQKINLWILRQRHQERRDKL